MRTVIMAGGRGTRIASVAGDVPKPMIPVAGRPVLEHMVNCLARQGFDDIILAVGFMRTVIQDYFGDGSRFGVRISYCVEEQPLGSGGALAKLRDSLPEDFLLLNGDIIFDVDLERLVFFHRENRALATVVAHPNSHPFDSALLVTDRRGMVRDWLHKESGRGPCYRNCVNAGIHVLSPGILANLPPREKLDLDRDIIGPALSSGKVFAYTTTEYIKDMGTPERYDLVCRDVLSGKVSARNLAKPQKAVFLDRDGVLNVHKGFISRWEDIELIEGAAEAVRAINAGGFLAIVVTNQPVVARGECDIDELERIHQRLEVLLGQEGAYVDDVFYCPHHPDRGFPGERPEYKTECECRKPKPGMIVAAAKKYNIDLAGSFMVGDERRDIEAAMAAGVRPVWVGGKSPPVFWIPEQVRNDGSPGVNAGLDCCAPTQ
jgi:D-glycero-D-manno-heptose 1,7-bisphosphate phosphatase